jgi:fructokinase
VVLYGAVEIGGTKTDLAVGTSFADMSEPHRVPTFDPDSTIDQITEFFANHKVDAIGVASFGPIDLDRSTSRYGTMLFTPKPGWTGTPIHDRLQSKTGVPVVLDTDVNGAALGEGRWGAARGMENYVYVTVGTGIGAGVVVHNTTIGGGTHPEMGHIAVSPLEGDRHGGSCPYHGACLEGMAAGPALESRFGRPESWEGNDQVVTVAVHYVAQGLLNLVYTVAPERIIVGGGVSGLPGFHDRLRERLDGLLAGYPQTPDLDLLVSKPGLGDRSGLAGALVLAASGGE